MEVEFLGKNLIITQHPSPSFGDIIPAGAFFKSKKYLFF
jgi:hypothetical protein